MTLGDALWDQLRGAWWLFVILGAWFLASVVALVILRRRGWL